MDASKARTQAQRRRDTKIVIGICTSNRPDLLQRLLDQVSRLSFLQRTPELVTLVIVDNSPEASAQPVIERFAAEGGVAVRYMHLHRRNLSTARNMVFDGAAEHGDLLAILDDDELPEPGWLDRLVECHLATGAPIVTGPVFPRLPPDTPAWMARGHFFALSAYPDRAELHDGITGNALFHLPTVRTAGLRFDVSYGRSGGEDQLFFRQAAAQGIDIRYAAQATVYEPVPPNRARLSYLIRRETRKGNTLGLIAREHPELGEGPGRRLAAALKWSVVGASMMASGLWHNDASLSYRGVLRGARALGMMGGLLGWRYTAY